MAKAKTSKNPLTKFASSPLFILFNTLVLIAMVASRSLSVLPQQEKKGDISLWVKAVLSVANTPTLTIFALLIVLALVIVPKVLPLLRHKVNRRANLKVNDASVIILTDAFEFFFANLLFLITVLLITYWVVQVSSFEQRRVNTVNYVGQIRSGVFDIVMAPGAHGTGIQLFREPDRKKLRIMLDDLRSVELESGFLLTPDDFARLQSIQGVGAIALGDTAEGKRILQEFDDRPGVWEGASMRVRMFSLIETGEYAKAAKLVDGDSQATGTMRVFAAEQFIRINRFGDAEPILRYETERIDRNEDVIEWNAQEYSFAANAFGLYAVVKQKLSLFEDALTAAEKALKFIDSGLDCSAKTAAIHLRLLRDKSLLTATRADVFAGMGNWRDCSRAQKERVEIVSQLIWTFDCIDLFGDLGIACDGWIYAAQLASERSAVREGVNRKSSEFKRLAEKFPSDVIIQRNLQESDKLVKAMNRKVVATR